mmetsp:Transcript_61852/g.151229  ORF Transcript_61852/g.151229 Transcript_61852/m.151229 type:complete len:508 (+) Transcript_61852:213-1736(+)
MNVLVHHVRLPPFTLLAVIIVVFAASSMADMSLVEGFSSSSSLLSLFPLATTKAMKIPYNVRHQQHRPMFFSAAGRSRHQKDEDDDTYNDECSDSDRKNGDNNMMNLDDVGTKVKNFLLTSSSQYAIINDDMDIDRGRRLSNATMDRMISFVVSNNPNLLVLDQHHEHNQPDLFKHADAQTTTTTTPTDTNHDTTTTTTSNKEVQKMVIFDKDGTLGDCNASLKRWVYHMVKMIRTNSRHHTTTAADASSTDDSLLDQNFYDKVGWDSDKDQVTPSAPVAAGTWEQITEIVYDFLMEHKDHFGYGRRHRPSRNIGEDSSSVESSLRMLAKEWSYGLDDVHGDDDPVIDNLKGMIEECHEMGYLVAVCTSDDRAGTDLALKAWGIDRVVDVSICGDEVNGHGKPSPVPLQLLCERATEYVVQNRPTQQTSSIRPITPQNCIMVGDTTADTGMAIAANVGFCVGVLTGSGTTEQLLGTGADLVVDDVGHIPSLLKTFELVSQYGLDEEK